MISGADHSCTFADLGLPERLVKPLARQGISTPFPIQAACIPDVLAGRDVLGRGKTGSGKTLAFGLPMLARIADAGTTPKRPLALVLVPTRGLNLRMAVVIGQASMAKQVTALRRGVHVLVATPGRLKDLIRQGACDLSRVEITVLDEADQMADMGFLPDVTGILDLTPGDAQRLLFSATLDKDVDVLVRRYLVDPVTHAIGAIDDPVPTMDHHLLVVAPADKGAVTAEIANRTGRTIMFARTKRGVDRLAAQLAKVGVRTGTLHGGKRQQQRSRTLADFRDGSFGVLIATDVAARGLHVDDVSLVVHIDPPTDHKGYLHRAGRTARAGGQGTVVTLVLPHQVRATSSMIRKAGVEAVRTKVGAGDSDLNRLTGARPPSGHPIVISPADRPSPSAGARRPKSKGRDGKARDGKARVGAVPAGKGRDGGKRRVAGEGGDPRHRARHVAAKPRTAKRSHV
jgi:superfamily II DNA/RNA helicase